MLDAGADAFEGDRLAGAPRSQGSLFASDGTLLGDEVALELLYGYSFIGDVLTRIGERAGGERLPAYDLHTLPASVSKDAWTVTVYADNLLDEYAVTSVRQTPARIGRTWTASPRGGTSPTCSPRSGHVSGSATRSARASNEARGESFGLPAEPYEDRVDVGSWAAQRRPST